MHVQTHKFSAHKSEVATHILHNLFACSTPQDRSQEKSITLIITITSNQKPMPHPRSVCGSTVRRHAVITMKAAMSPPIPPAIPASPVSATDDIHRKVSAWLPGQ
mmetsp:Transcript_110065/g.201742  ORF Transcript_110065/g.201742 Transcript_110065/m.201742 type:complete len:105 (+) Transcript_110065:14-328(+)